MVNSFIKWLALSFLMMVSAVGYAQEFPKQSSPPRLVNDFASIFTSQQINALEKKLVAFSDTTSTQIAVVSVKSLGGMDISTYATELAQAWGIGVKGKDNGVLVLVKPKVGTAKGETFIAVGYGLEGAIPDVIASRIVREVMLPNFQNSQMYKGVDEATSLLMGFASGEYSADAIASKEESGGASVLFFVIAMIVISFLRASARQRSATSQTYTGNNTTTNIPPILFFGPTFGRSHSSRSGGFGGGFGGFGGGGFGGGGAGGSW